MKNLISYYLDHAAELRPVVSDNIVQFIDVGTNVDDSIMMVAYPVEFLIEQHELSQDATPGQLFDFETRWLCGMPVPFEAATDFETLEQAEKAAHKINKLLSKLIRTPFTFKKSNE